MSELYNEDVLRFFKDSNLEEFLYLPTIGINKCNINLYTEHVHKQGELMFKILNKLKFEYAIFAGSSIGKVRTNEMMMWFDDYDIIVMNEHKDFFRDEIIPVLKRYGFRFWGWGTEKRGDEEGITFVSGKYFEDKAFRLDVFWSFIDENGKLRNVAGKGLYHKIGMDKDLVMPYKLQNFHGIENIPFFNDHISEVELTYGDVENECVIHTHNKHAKGIRTRYKHWNIATKDFEYLKQLSVNNMKALIPNYSEYKPEKNTMLLDEKYSSTIDVFTHISNEKIGIINCIDPGLFTKHAPNISFYFPGIQMNLFLSDIKKLEYVYLNYADNVFVKNDELATVLEELVYVNKPNIEVANVITFGTFDLFHTGHKNILRKCSQISDNVVVGVSSDKLNEEKNKIANDPLETRKANVEKAGNVHTVFTEDSLERKDDYIKEFGANLLVMGDDWKDEFNWVSCYVLYFRRTEGISSTELRNLYSGE